MRIRPPDWLVYGVLAAALFGGALFWRERAMAPEPPPPVPGAAQLPIPASSPFAAAPVVAVKATAARAGRTAFSVADSGIWVSAGATCPRPGLMIADGRAVAARRLPGVGPLEVLSTAGPGVAGLPLAPVGDLRPGKTGFLPGFPEGGPGEIAVRLVGPARLAAAGRLRAGASVLAFAEIGHTEGMTGARRGLAGAPVLDRQGQVMAVALSPAPRRGLIYAVPLETLRDAIDRARADPGASGPGEPMDTDSYGRAADALRRDLRVVQLVCLAH